MAIARRSKYYVVAVTENGCLSVDYQTDDITTAVQKLENTRAYTPEVMLLTPVTYRVKVEDITNQPDYAEKACEDKTDGGF